MDIEQTLRLACVPPEPGRDFEDTVMARVSAAAWRAEQLRPRKSRRVLLIGALIAVAAAAATFATWNNGPQPDLALEAGTVEPAAPTVAQAAPALSATATLAAAPTASLQTPPPAPKFTEVAQRCSAADAATPAPSRYTVLVQPLQFESNDPVIQSQVREYYNALLDALRKVPGLALAGAEAQIATGKPADYRITVAAGGWGAQSTATTQRLRTGVESWNGTAFTGPSGTSREVSTLDISRCPSSGALNCGPVAAASVDVGLFVGLNRLPRYPGEAQVACDRAMQAFAQPAFERLRSGTDSVPLIRQGLEYLAATAEPTYRANRWSLLRSNARPNAVDSLVAALRETNDPAFSKEVVTLLAVKFAGDPTARESLATVATAGTNTLTGHVAELALSGDGPWRDYVVARVRDASLPAAQRLEAVNWMIDATSLDPQQMTATLGTVLTKLQESGGIPVLARLLVDTQKDEGNDITKQWGSWVMGRLGSLNRTPVEYPPAAVDLLIACFDAMPAQLTLNNLAALRADPRVASKLESIATDLSNPQLAERAARSLR